MSSRSPAPNPVHLGWHGCPTAGCASASAMIVVRSLTQLNRIASLRLYSRATRGKPIQEAREVQDVQHGRRRARIAVRVGLSRGVAVQEACEVVDVQDRACRAAVAV